MSPVLFFLRKFGSLLFLCAFLLSPTKAFSEKTEIGGVVRDSLSKETLPYVSVYFEKTDLGTITDMNGTFSLSTEESGYLVFSMMGYRDKKIYVNADGRKRPLHRGNTPPS